MPIVLALDAGTGGAKCVAIDHRGRVRGSAARRWSYDVEINAQVSAVKEYSFDADEFWSTLCLCARRALADLDASQVVAVISTSQREGCVFLDDAGRELYAGPNLDSRAFMEGLQILEELGASRLYQITGHSAPFIFPLARYLWFRANDSRRIAHLLMLNDWILYRACGACVGEPSNATESMLFDFRGRRWSPEIIEQFDVDADILPRIGTPGEKVGEIDSKAAAALGITAGTAVHLGGADTQCALLGLGASDAGDAGVVLGTTAPVQVVSDQPLLDPAENLWAGCHVAGDRWVLESNAGSSGDGYEWLLDLLVRDGGGDAYARAEERARTGRPFQVLSFGGPRLFDLTKVRPDMPGAVFFPFPALQLRPDSGDLLRSHLESIAFAVRGNLEQLRSCAGELPATLRVGGGMSRNSLLVQLIADVTGCRIARATVADCTALGCAILACVGQGLYADAAAACAAMCQSVEVEPTGDADAASAAYEKWRSLYDTLDGVSI